MLPLTGAAPIERPHRDRPADGSGIITRFIAPMRSARYWTALAHQMVVQPAIATVTFVVTVTWVSITASGLTSFIWRPLSDQRPADRLFATYDIGTGATGVWITEAAIYLLVGIVGAITLPWIVTGCVRLHEYPMRAMLGR